MPLHWSNIDDIFFRSSPLEMRDSDAQRLSSSHPLLEWRLLESMRPLTTPSWSAILTSEVISTAILSFPVEPPCTPALPTECRRRLPIWLLPPWKLKSLLHQKESTPYGLVVPSFRPSQPSSKCGSPSRSMMSLEPALFTENASKIILIRKVL